MNPRLGAWALSLFVTAWSADGHGQDRKKRGRPRRSQPAQTTTPEAADRRAAPAAGETAEGDRPVVQVEESGRKKVYRIKTEFVIEGRIQKPNAFYVLQRSNINYDWVDLKQEFVPRILQSVREHPF
jgi:hypothetical protein